MSRTGDAFLAHLANRRHTTAEKAKRRRKKKLRIRPLRQPDALRRKYAKTIRDLLAPVVERVRTALAAQGPGFVEEESKARADASGLRLDTASKASKMIRKLADELLAEFTPEKIGPVARKMARETSDFHKTQMATQIRSALAIDVAFTDPALSAMVDTFTAENVALIRTIPARMFDDVESTLLRDLSKGLRWEEIAPKIEDRFGVTSTRADLIARDQAGKFFGDLNASRQADLGVTRFVWRTARDNRVRVEHMEREGVSYEWSDPPEGETPGEPINCRCQAEPDLQPLLDAMNGDTP